MLKLKSIIFGLTLFASISSYAITLEEVFGFVANGSKVQITCVDTNAVSYVNQEQTVYLGLNREVLAGTTLVDLLANFYVNVQFREKSNFIVDYTAANGKLATVKTNGFYTHGLDTNKLNSIQLGSNPISMKISSIRRTRGTSFPPSTGRPFENVMFNTSNCQVSVLP